MYHHIVARKVRATFADISAGDHESMLAGMAPTFTYRFYGDHALGGERHTVAALRSWWERTDRLIPGARFDVEDVVVAGPPWATKISTRVCIRGHLANGEPYRNVFMQMMRMRWARITDVHTLEDTAVLINALNRMAADGIHEAVATPIVG